MENRGNLFRHDRRLKFKGLLAGLAAALLFTGAILSGCGQSQSQEILKTQVAGIQTEETQTEEEPQEAHVAYNGGGSWFGTKRGCAVIADISLREAFETSCIWYFRKILDITGKESVQEYLDALSYGNCDISSWEAREIFPYLYGFSFRRENYLPRNIEAWNTGGFPDGWCGQYETVLMAEISYGEELPWYLGLFLDEDGVIRAITSCYPTAG